jgi:hypothetical protein
MMIEKFMTEGNDPVKTAIATCFLVPAQTQFPQRW